VVLSPDTSAKMLKYFFEVRSYGFGTVAFNLLALNEMNQLSVFK
jgi:hypothetical protein